MSGIEPDESPSASPSGDTSAISREDLASASSSMEQAAPLSPASRGVVAGLDPDAFRRGFMSSDVPQCIAAAETGRLMAINDAFCALCGYSRHDLLADSFEGLDRLFAHVEGAPRPCTEAVARPMTLVRKDRAVLPVKMTISFGADSGGVDAGSAESYFLPVMYAFCSLQDVSRVHQLETAVRQTRESARAQLEANLRVMQITNRIMALPRLLEFIEAFDEPRFLFEGVCDFLTAARGMEFAGSAIFRKSQEDDGEVILEKQSAESDYPARLQIDDNNPVCMVIREEIPMYQDEAGNIVVPITFSGQVDGALSVQYHDVTTEVIEDDRVVQDTLFDVVITISRVLGQRLDNIALLEQIRKQTITDPLTRVYNRRFFDERIAEEFTRARRYSRPLSLIMIDLDKFKDVNDTLGHQQGDSVLIEFSDLCRITSRKQDLICRLGGDEFAMILPDTQHWAAAVKAEKLRKKIERHVFRNIIRPGEPVKIWLSVGVAGYYEDMTEVKAFYQEADDVLYASKENGRNRVTVARPDAARAEAAETQRRKELERQREAARNSTSARRRRKD
ncbi:MAG: diguanylate cyclase [Planctomycetota bacterium]